MASMRPEDFSPGNPALMRQATGDRPMASMRPEDFSPGNMAAMAATLEQIDAALQ